jgi:hypothetical protein
MSKNRLSLHFAAIMAVVLFVFLAIGSAQQQKTTPAPAPTPTPAPAPRPTDNTDRIISSDTKSDIDRVDALEKPANKPYDALGLVFATSVTRFDENGYLLTSQENIVLLLLREAQKLGANDIFNLRKDTNTTVAYTQVTTNGVTRMARITTITVTGSALAVKYRN